MSTLTEFRDSFNKLNDLLREMVKNKATADQMGKFTGEYVQENLGNSPYLAMCSGDAADLLKGGLSFDETLKRFKALDQETRVVICLLQEMTQLTGEGHSDFRPQDHRETLDNGAKVLAAMKEIIQ